MIGYDQERENNPNGRSEDGVEKMLPKEIG